MKTKTIIAVTAIAVAFSASALAAPSHQKKSKTRKNSAYQHVTSTYNSSIESRLRTLENRVDDLSPTRTVGSADSTRRGYMQSLTELYAHGPAVVTSPALGVRASAQDASDLMVNLPSMNEDLRILEVRQKMNQFAASHGIPVPERPLVALSGGVEGQVVAQNDFDNQTTTNADVDLTRAEVDVIGDISSWMTAVMKLSYDNSAQPFAGVNASRISNARIQLSRGFIVLGNLMKSPLYTSIGQMYLPFGDYASFMVSTPVTRALGKIQERAIVGGFSSCGLYGSVYAFQGHTLVYDHNDYLNRGGVNLGYKYSQGLFSMNVGGGYTGNLAESLGMQRNMLSSPAFTGFERYDVLHHRVEGLNLHAMFTYNGFNLLGEYVGALRTFDVRDLSFNGKAARPEAGNVELAYQFKIKDIPNTLAVGYDRTREALGVNLPEQSYFVSYGTSLLRDTIESLEYRHDINYGAGTTANGGGLPVANQVVTTGRTSRNAVVFQVGVYF